VGIKELAQLVFTELKDFFNVTLHEKLID